MNSAHIHHAAGWRGSGLAIRGAGAAVGENSDIGNTPAVESQRVAAFVQRLRELG